jgi:predicted enzyme related to lactoylglutathione lyase
LINNTKNNLNQDKFSDTGGVLMPRVVHFEISSDEPEKAIEFYKKTFGWEFQKWEGPMEYWLIMTGDKNQPGIDGGLGRKSPENLDKNVIDVDDVDEALNKVEANGGTILRPKMAIPGVGYIAYFKDPDGNIFGLMKDDPEAK